MNTPHLEVERLDAQQTVEALPALIELLRDAVDSGASVGFLPPLSLNDAQAYWWDVVAAVRNDARILLVARDEAGIAGTVQVDPAKKPNAPHRAELIKLLVHTRARRRGLGRALMVAAEREARTAGRTLLVLDTVRGSVAENLYSARGFTRAGEIPAYTREGDGTMLATVIYYLHL